MNYLIAKRKRTNNTYFAILSQENKIYDIPDDILNIREYDTNYKLEEDEWFGITDFNASQYSIPLLTKDFNTAEHHQITQDEYNLVKFFCAYQDEDYFCFQKFLPSTIIKRRWLSLSGEPKIEIDKPILILRTIPDAIYKVSEDTLYFKNLSDIKSIFPSIIELHKEATDDETEAFLNSNFIELGEGFDKNKVNTANRKRIAMAMETLAQIKEEEKGAIHQYIRNYCPDLEFSEEKRQFKIESEEHLKNLIFGIDQRFYTTQIGAEKRLANSIVRLAE